MNNDDDLSALELEAMLALGDDVAPPNGLRAALLDVAAGPWWRGFARRAGALLDLDDNAVAALFASFDDAERWADGPNPGLWLFHIDAGPELAGAITGFVEMAAGATFPHHRHVGVESVLVLAGSIIDGEREHHVGAEVTMAGHTEHAVTAGAAGCVYLAVSRDGIAFDGEEPIGPDDPRA